MRYELSLRSKQNNVALLVGTDPELQEKRSFDENSPVIRPTVSHSTEARLGVDGSGEVIEFRPNAFKNVSKLVDDIKDIMDDCPPVSVKGEVYACGAHIHFGFDKNMIGKRYGYYEYSDEYDDEYDDEYEDEEEERDNTFAYNVFTICKVLDDLLGKHLIDLSGEARGSYKRLTKWEEKPWGFEYRSLPSAILVNPKIAEIVFKIARESVKTLLQNGSLTIAHNKSYDDYKNYITEEEYAYFMSFPEEYERMNKDIVNKNWGTKTVYFRDEWNSDVKEYIQEECSKRGIKDIVFFGLKQDRGDNVISGFELKGYETIEVDLYRNATKCFGLPYVIRRGVPKDVDKFLNAIERTLK